MSYSAYEYNNNQDFQNKHCCQVKNESKNVELQEEREEHVQHVLGPSRRIRARAGSGRLPKLEILRAAIQHIERLQAALRAAAV
ncbi:MYOD-like DNA-binding protein, partial [Operophtera brumata]